MSKFSTIVVNVKGNEYKILPEGIIANYKTPLTKWEAEYAALAHGISKGIRYIGTKEPLAYYFAAIRGTITDTFHPYIKRANKVFSDCEIKSRSAVEFEFSSKKDGNIRGIIKFSNNEVDIISFLNSVRVDSI